MLRHHSVFCIMRKAVQTGSIVRDKKGLLNGRIIMVELNENAVAYMKKRNQKDIVLDVLEYTS